MAEEAKQNGAVKIDTEVLGSIAGIAAKHVPGVYRIKRGFVAGIAQMFRKSADAGIRVVVGEGEVSFELGIIVEYGVNIPEVTFQVQKGIRQEVEKMSGLKVTKVDVLIRGVHIPGKQMTQDEESHQ